MEAPANLLQPFNIDRPELWDSWVEGFRSYLAFRKITETAMQRALLISACGTETVDLARALLQPRKLTETPVDDIISALEKYFQPQPTKLTRHWDFRQRTQRAGESAMMFLTSLRRMASRCSFTDLNEALLDQFVWGLRDEKLAQKLLSLSDCDLTKAVDVATSWEKGRRAEPRPTRQATAHQVDPEPSAEDSDEDRALQTGHRSASRKPAYFPQGTRHERPPECISCGGKHERKTCRFRDATCRLCNKAGHIACACRSKTRARVPHRSAHSEDQQNFETNSLNTRQHQASAPNDRSVPRMDYLSDDSLVPCGQDRYISRNELLLHLKTYNLYYEGQNLQLRHREEDGEFIVEGLLNISWGLRRPIRLQMQDDHQRIRPPPSSSSWHSGCNLGAHGSVIKPTNLPDIQVSDASSSTDGADGDDKDLKSQQEDVPQLMRTRSDVGVRRRGNLRTPSEQRRIRRHRFSINGHFYNHKTSVFTPAYGSITNVRINSTMTTPQVLKLLLNKFKIENSAEEFALYIVHTSGEKQKLKATDYPLVARILQGPCEQVCKVFLMEKDQVEEVTYDVAQYIKFEMPVLKSFIQKLKEEEDREVKKLKRKYSVLRLMIEQRLGEIAEGRVTM